jgi:hypothetical protein
MRKIVPLMTLTALAAVVAIAAPPLRGVAQQPAAPEETRPADMAPAPFNPQLSALMNMLIQPRHAKLGLAGKAENWALAGYMFGELKQSVAVIGRAVPRWKGLPVPDLFDAALSQSFAVLDFAIKAGEPGQFGQAYDRLTQGCNNCHATMDHSYIVIKSPEGTGAFPNQEFKPPAR